MDSQISPEPTPVVEPPAVVEDVPVEPGVVKDTWYWIKDSKGYGSVTVTMVFIAFWVTTLAFVVSIIDHVGPLTIRQFDVAACSAYFIPILTLYFGRKFTEAKFNSEGK